MIRKESWPAAFLVTALVTGLSPDPAHGPVRELTAQEAVVIDEWDVPWEGSRPRDPYVAPDGRVWFVGQTGNYVACLDPADGSFGRFDPVSGAVDLVPVPTPNSRPYGIVVDAEDRPWVSEFAGGKLATLDPVTLDFREYELGRAETWPRRLMITSDGGVWYVDFAGGLLGRLDRETGVVREYPLPGGAGARPYGMVVDEDDVIWLVETGLRPNRFVGFDTETENLVSVTEIPSGAGSVRHMYYDAERREVWFATDANTVGRARLP